MFAPDISRLGYTDQGRVYSIICPQQGVESPSLGSINLEVTVTGQRGWVDENTRSLACDMSVEAKAWFVLLGFWHAASAFLMPPPCPLTFNNWFTMPVRKR